MPVRAGGLGAALVSVVRRRYRDVHAVRQVGFQIAAGEVVGFIGSNGAGKPVVLLAAFWTERVHAVVTFGRLVTFVLGGAAAPVGFLPDPWRAVAVTLPFHAMLGLPADIATGTIGGADALVAFGRALAWILALGGLAAVVWRAGVRRYTVIGA